MQRSGTNYAKAQIELSCPNARVLALLLGDKHELPRIEEAALALRNGDLGGALTDLDSAELQEAVDAALDGSLKVLICVRDPILWIHSYSRYIARKAGVEPEKLTRERGTELVDEWLDYHLTLKEWCKTTKYQTAWLVHYTAVRHPARPVVIAESWGAVREVEPQTLGYLKRGGDEHGAVYVGEGTYKPNQYKRIYAGMGLVQEQDITFLLDRIAQRDPQGVSKPWIWKSALREQES